MTDGNLPSVIGFLCFESLSAASRQIEQAHHNRAENDVGSKLKEEVASHKSENDVFSDIFKACSRAPCRDSVKEKTKHPSRKIPVFTKGQVIAAAMTAR